MLLKRPVTTELRSRGPFLVNGVMESLLVELAGN